jgi:hypothetical protein
MSRAKTQWNKRFFGKGKLRQFTVKVDRRRFAVARFARQHHE